MMLCYYW